METQIAFPAMVKEYRTANNLTMEQLADKIGKTKSTISKWEKGTRSPKIQEIEEIANFFNVEPAIMMFGAITTDTPTQAPSELVTAITDTVVQLHPERQEIVLDVATEQLEEQEKESSVTSIIETTELEDDEDNYLDEELVEYHVYERLSAGLGTGYTDDGNYDIVYSDLDINHDFASWIYGDSMEPKYLNGQVALIKQTGFDYDGAIYAIEWDGQTYIKNAYKEEKGLRLVSLNKKYADKFAAWEEEPRIIGKIVGHFTPMER
ncbi:XRE family transcriptional regulator [Streptococcus sp. sy004]|uniref:XRE family transcriptional regulator n=1 Tax=Streptococcus sp. sy004 TaxID=2600149 RepID=UPI0011B4B1B2|nr:S24 family peptidase [Streptococcus sp. sy004]TWT12045.1 helix-turn-helix transcriptional regulator [Streptococcus sp. sy004]